MGTSIAVSQILEQDPDLEILETLMDNIVITSSLMRTVSRALIEISSTIKLKHYNYFANCFLQERLLESEKNNENYWLNLFSTYLLETALSESL